jgi:hypothetical protein
VNIVSPENFEFMNRLPAVDINHRDERPLTLEKISRSAKMEFFQGSDREAAIMVLSKVLVHGDLQKTG